MMEDITLSRNSTLNNKEYEAHKKLCQELLCFNDDPGVELPSGFEMETGIRVFRY